METDLCGGVKVRATPLSPGNQLLSDYKDSIQGVSSVRKSYETELEQVLEEKENLYGSFLFFKHCFKYIFLKSNDRNKMFVVD
ncbi:hypothetical protein P8452_42942 [Trifolium repens]|nr:hypothetical protein P8452_42942 [Trifolium repens]